MRVVKALMMLACVLFVTGPVHGDEGHEHVLDTSEEGMKAISKSLGVQCNHCHIQKTPEGKPDFEAPSKMKATAIHMKTHFVDQLTTADGKPVDCQTCHNGHAKFVPREPQSDLPRLAANMERREVMAIMRGFTKALDVKCLFCHEKATDGRMDPTIPTKYRRMARHMYDTFGSMKLLDGQPVTCNHCHGGKAEFLPRHGE